MKAGAKAIADIERVSAEIVQRKLDYTVHLREFLREDRGGLY